MQDAQRNRHHRVPRHIPLGKRDVEHRRLGHCAVCRYGSVGLFVGHRLHASTIDGVDTNARIRSAIRQFSAWR